MKRALYAIVALCLAASAGSCQAPAQPREDKATKPVELILSSDKQVYEGNPENLAPQMVAKGASSDIDAIKARLLANDGVHPGSKALSDDLQKLAEYCGIQEGDGKHMSNGFYSKVVEFPRCHIKSLYFVTANGREEYRFTEVAAEKSLKNVDLSVGMPRLEAEQRIATARGTKVEYSPYDGVFPEQVRYENGAEVMVVHYKPGAPAPTIVSSSSEAVGYPPIDSEVLSWEIVGPKDESQAMLIQAEYPHKIVYTNNSIVVQGSLREDCQRRGGRFNECGSPCDERKGGACIAVCALTCELGK